jgi:Mitochondrial small ribosomal subunit Rsm22
MKALSWQTLDWAALDRLRGIFLAGRPPGAAYWSSPNDLANYDFTYAQRIGWKWDAVQGELKQRGWSPPPGPLLDWGCGSGIASRRVVEFFGAERFERLRVFDHSALAMEFAAEAAQAAFPKLAVEQATAGWLAGNKPAGTLVISHVLNELDEAGGRELRRVIDRAQSVLWVEPGTHADSRALIALREALREQFRVIAPCTHEAGCGLLAPENARHWCHHFAATPKGIMADSDWVRFAQRAGLDLRSLPYSFLVLERMGLRAPVPGLLPEGWSRVLGEPRVYKGFARALCCQANGVRELELQKRVAPEVHRAFKDGRAPSLWRWKEEGRRIVGLEPFVECDTFSLKSKT